MRYVVALVAVSALIPGGARAQGRDSLSSPPPSGAAAQMEALARLQPDNTVRVHVLGHGWLSGVVVRSHADSLVLSSDDHDRVVPTAAIDSALVRHGHAGMGAGLGALVGMIVGVSVGGCEGPPATSLGQAAAEIGPQMQCGLGHMMAGFAVGALVGAALGAAVPSWEPRVPVAASDSQAPPEAH